MWLEVTEPQVWLKRGAAGISGLTGQHVEERNEPFTEVEDGCESRFSSLVPCYFTAFA